MVNVTGYKTVTVGINNWKFKRQVKIGDGQVGLQVTVPSCAHCSTCQKRVKLFTETLATKPNILGVWTYLYDGAQWLFFSVPCGKDPITVLSEALDISVTVYFY